MLKFPPVTPDVRRHRAVIPEHVKVAVGEVLATSDKAVHVVVAGRPLWLPLSCIDGEPPEVGRGGVIRVALWLVEREELPETDEDEDDEGPSPITLFACRRSTTATLRRVRHSTFGLGGVMAVEGDKSVVRFDSGSQKTILTRFLEDV